MQVLFYGTFDDFSNVCMCVGVCGCLCVNVWICVCVCMYVCIRECGVRVWL